MVLTKKQSFETQKLQHRKMKVWIGFPLLPFFTIVLYPFWRITSRHPFIETPRQKEKKNSPPEPFAKKTERRFFWGGGEGLSRHFFLPVAMSTPSRVTVPLSSSIISWPAMVPQARQTSTSMFSLQKSIEPSPRRIFTPPE